MCYKHPDSREGQISQVGWLTQEGATIDLKAITYNVFTLRGIAVGSRAQFYTMNRAIAAHLMKPLIDRVFSFDEAKEAFSYFKKASKLGKVIIRFP
jgi:D-arabinose 1-dehydrogenase-like Zn-dependent alcohol dehydrogenase